MNSKRSFPSIVVCKYTSLDDAIEVLNPGAEKPTPIAAFYLFTGPREAKYFSHSINSQVNYINHIPSQLTGKSWHLPPPSQRKLNEPLC